MTTIKDIARAIGLSPTTVSLVLNNKPNKISESTKKKIFKAARDLNYYPNRLAVGLAKKRTNTIGLILPDISNVYFAALAFGVDSQARKHGWNIIFSSSFERCDRDLEGIHVLYSRGVDAIIIAIASHSANKHAREYLNVMKSIPIPFICVDRCEPEFRCSSVMLDQKKGLYIATKHLLDLGHTKTACITGPLSQRTTTQRLEGFKWAYDEAGLPEPKNAIFEGDFSVESGYDMAGKILKGDFSAILAFNDMMAYGVYKNFKENDISIPDDISIVGFDDLMFSDIVYPPLTTVHQPASEIGAEAMNRAISEVENNAPRQNIFFEPSLIIRKSTKKYIT